MTDLIAQRWDEVYQQGKYSGDPPLRFCDDIVQTLGQEQGRGLYIGCGNGRNYIPLVEEGLDLKGIDISPEAIRQLQEALPDADLECTDFLSLPETEQYPYIISIQVFQHGNRETVAKYFTKTARLLQPEGILFLRVNSIETEIYDFCNEIEVNRKGDLGKTIKYIQGEKNGLYIHFFSESELRHLRDDHGFDCISEHMPYNKRTPPRTGFWAQWETIWKKQDSTILELKGDSEN